MKKFSLLVALLITSLGVRAQVAEFVFIDDDLAWQKIYESPMTYDEIGKALVAAKVMDVVGFEDSYTCRVANVPVVWKELGIKWAHMNTVALNSDHIEADITIQCKDGRYRVTAQNIAFRTRPSSGVWKGEAVLLSDIALKNGVITKGFRDMKLDLIVGHALARNFEFRKALLDDEW